MRSNPIRFTGMASGMDTDSIVKDLMRPQKYKIDQEKKAQALLTLKQDAWKDMNKKLYDFHTKFTDKLRSGTGLENKMTTSSHPDSIEIINGENIPEGTHKIRISNLATSTSVAGIIDKTLVDGELKASTTVGQLTGSKAEKIQIGMTVNNEVVKVEIGAGDSLQSVAQKMNAKLKGKGFNAGYDPVNERFFVNATKTGSKQTIKFDSAFEMAGEPGKEVVTGKYSGLFNKLGLGASTEPKPGLDAKYFYNDMELISESNQIEVNGIKATIKAGNLGETIMISAVSDPDATYNAIKEFVTEYNKILEDVNSKISTKPGKDIEPLTAEERDSMSDTEIKLWEDKINDSLFYKDPQLTSFLDSARSVLSQIVGDGEYKSLAALGIVTGSWQEKGKLHIMGDEDDELYSKSPNKLKEAIAKNPDDVVKFLKGQGQKLYEAHNKTLVASNKLKSAMNFYNDKVMAEKMQTSEKRVFTLEERMYKMEEMQYRKFAAMEKMLSSLNNQSSWLSQQFGGM